VSTHSAEAPATETASASPVPGMALWVLVLGALAYGVAKTVDTAAALFGG
jgi:hypothetical protein